MRRSQACDPLPSPFFFSLSLSLSVGPPSSLSAQPSIPENSSSLFHSSREFLGPRFLRPFPFPDTPASVSFPLERRPRGVTSTPPGKRALDLRRPDQEDGSWRGGTLVEARQGGRGRQRGSGPSRAKERGGRTFVGKGEKGEGGQQARKGGVVILVREA